MTRLPQPLGKMRIGPSGRAALHLLARCPRLPTDVVAVLLRMRHTRSAAQLLLRLRTAGLARHETYEVGPFVQSRAVRLWTLTAAGSVILGTRGEALPDEEFGMLPYGLPARWRDVARCRDVPMLVAAYRLLACHVRELDQPVRLAAWEHPWIRTQVQTATGRARRVRVPAAAALIQHNADCERTNSVLLLPDLDTVPVVSYRQALRELVKLRAASESADVDEAF